MSLKSNKTLQLLIYNFNDSRCFVFGTKFAYCISGMSTKILVVDDEITKLTPLVDSLAKEGYEVDGVEDGISALSKVESTKYDAVITDMRLPGLDGIELLKKIKTISKDTEVILITAYPSPETNVAAIKAGAYDYIEKPFSNDDIILKLKELKNVKPDNGKAVFDSNFLNDIQEETEELVNICYQCKKCAAGCPMVEEMDYTPSQIIHAIRLGLKDLVLNSKTIWLCASCETCTTRCPQELDIAKLMDGGRIVAVREGVKPKIPEVKMFYDSMLQNIRMFGRVYELGLIGSLKMKTKEFTKDMDLGMKMFKKGKLKIFPDFKNTGKVKKIFKRAGKK